MAVDRDPKIGISINSCKEPAQVQRMHCTRQNAEDRAKTIE